MQSQADSAAPLHHGRILAPMVRVGTLPFRLLALQYGAHLVYTEELIDRKLARCVRAENTALGCVDYVVGGKDPMHKPMPSDLAFRTCPRLEKPKLVLQLGTNDPLTAVAAAKLVEQDVAAIDVNMGCPKKFSTQMGAGAELLKDTAKAAAIVSALCAAVRVPVSCKIRILASREATVEFAKAMVRAGACAVAVHGRQDTVKSSEPATWEWVRAVSEAVDVPVIVSGDVWGFDDLARAQEETGCAGVMFARGALVNPSAAFGNNGAAPKPVLDCVRDYIALCHRWDERFQNIKYTIQQMYRYGEKNMETSGLPKHEMESLRKVRDIRAMYERFDMEFPDKVEGEGEGGEAKGDEGGNVVHKKQRK